MISSELGDDDVRTRSASAPWRRGLDLFDDYAGGGVLSEQLADDLVNELVGLTGSRARGARHRRSRTGPQPSRPATTPSAPATARPRLALVHGRSHSLTATSTT